MFRSSLSIFSVLTASILSLAAQNEAAIKPARKTVPGNQPALVKPDSDGKLQLLAANCEIYGNKIAVYEPQRCLGWWTSEEDHVVWEVELPKSGKFDVALEWAITDEWANNKFVIDTGKSKLEGTVPTTGGFDKYREEKFGQIELPQGRTKITMRSIGPIKGELADLRKMVLTPAGAAAVAGSGAPCYELRIHHAVPGKLEAVHERFRNYTLQLLEKHGIQSIGYWVPIDPADQKLVVLLSHPSREAVEPAWKAFVADPEWKAAYQKDGNLMEKVEKMFLQTTDYSPALKTGNISEKGVFELRTYTTPAGLLPKLDSRFREHTLKLFKKYGMNNWLYFHKTPDQPEADTTLIYFLTHASEEMAKASFNAFRKDTDWVAAKTESEKAGSLTVKDGVKSLMLVPTNYSPTK